MSNHISLFYPISLAGFVLVVIKMAETKNNQNPNRKTGQPARLYVKAAFVGYQRNKDTVRLQPTQGSLSVCVSVFCITICVCGRSLTDICIHSLSSPSLIIICTDPPQIQKNGIALLNIQGLNCREDTDFYLGKRVAFIYRADKARRNKKYRVIWGKVRRAHGNGGLVRATFRNNLPPIAMGSSTLRVMLYPSRV
jgi:large subunit ribosomal protein L35Ae